MKSGAAPPHLRQSMRQGHADPNIGQGDAADLKLMVSGVGAPMVLLGIGIPGASPGNQLTAGKVAATVTHAQTNPATPWITLLPSSAGRVNAIRRISPMRAMGILRMSDIEAVVGEGDRGTTRSPRQGRWQTDPIDDAHAAAFLTNTSYRRKPYATDIDPPPQNA